jgi:hypothetical protein
MGDMRKEDSRLPVASSQLPISVHLRAVRSVRYLLEMAEPNVSLSSLTDEEKRCLELMQSLLSSLPDDAAQLTLKRNSSGLIFQLTPANKRSAAFGIHYDGCVDVFFGDFGTTFEVPFGTGQPMDSFDAALALVKRAGHAVIAGKCRERAGFAGVRGTVEIDGRPYRVTHFLHFRLFPKTLHYEPYVPEALTSAS